MLSGYIGSPDTRFFRGTTLLICCPDRERYSCPLQSLVVSLLLSIVSTLVFSRTGGVLSHLNSSTHRFPWFLLRELVFPRHVRCVLSRLCCSGHSLLLSSYLSRIAESRILHAAPAHTCPRTPFISLCTVQLRTLSAARSSATECLSMTSGLSVCGGTEHSLKLNASSSRRKLLVFAVACQLQSNILLSLGQII